MTSAILLDVTSIQRYIFGSNKLKENIGASYIIEELVFKDLIGELINNGALLKLPDDYKKEFIYLKSKVEIAYIGGGNGLLLFSGETASDDATNFIREYSKLVIKYFPGVNIAVAQENGFDLEKFAEGRQAISKKLRENKSLYPHIAQLPKEGIFEDCPYSNHFAEVKRENIGYISLESCQKFEASKNARNEFNGFKLPDQLDHLGQDPEKGYIAVIHIDGNNIGSKFIRQSNLKNLRSLSDKVSRLAFETMDELLTCIQNQFDLLSKILKLKEETLPIRPILTGGDDITFVCEGTMGIYLAELFITLFEQKAINLKIAEDGEDPINACAGVAIVKTKYPFFKAYTLAEELCHEAKQVSRTNQGSWLSYYIAHTGISGDLKTLRAQNISNEGHQLSKCPYEVGGEMQKLKQCIQVFSGATPSNNEKTWPKNKVKELRAALVEGGAAEKAMQAIMNHRDIHLPLSQDKVWITDSDDSKQHTYYYDAIQLMDFYPTDLLSQPNEN